MQESIMYGNTDDTVTLLRLDLINIIRECEFEDTIIHSMREQYENLVGRISEFSDYGSIIRILKPESKVTVAKFYEIHSGFMIAPYARHTIQYCVGNADSKKVMLLVPDYMMNSIIRRIIGRPKVIARSINPVSNIDVSSLYPVFSYEYKYCENDVKATQEIWRKQMETYQELMMQPKLRIKNVIFNDPATIVFWYDGTKTVVKCQPGDTFDPEKGLAMAICKKILGTNGSQSNFNDFFKKWLPKEEEKKEPEVIGIIESMENTENGLLVKGKITKDLSFMTTAENASFSPDINEQLGILGK